KRKILDWLAALIRGHASDRIRILAIRCVFAADQRNTIISRALLLALWKRRERRRRRAEALHGAAMILGSGSRCVSGVGVRRERARRDGFLRRRGRFGEVDNPPDAITNDGPDRAPQPAQFRVFDCCRSCEVLRSGRLVPRSSWMPCIRGGVAPSQRLACRSSRGALFQAR